MRRLNSLNYAVWQRRLETRTTEHRRSDRARIHSTSDRAATFVVSPSPLRYGLPTMMRKYPCLLVNLLGASRDVASSTPVAIANHVWTYRGHERSSDGNYYRTIKDFSLHDSYTRRRESSRDGVHRPVIRHGRSIRERSSTASLS